MTVQGTEPPDAAGVGWDDAQSALLERLRAGDEEAFAGLVEDHHAAMVRVAMGYVDSRAVAEEAVQEAWLGVLRGLDSFESRSSLKTWIFSILLNVARRRGAQERRSVPLSSLGDPVDEGPAVDPGRFSPSPDGAHGMWTSPPVPWDERPEESSLSTELREHIGAAIAALPPAQRDVMRLRDIEGWDAADVCALLELTEGNQRVLLHRARSKVRQSLEEYFRDSGE